MQCQFCLNNINWKKKDLEKFEIFGLTRANIVRYLEREGAREERERAREKGG